MAEEFVTLHHREHPEAGSADRRLAEVAAEISRTGTYTHTARELDFGAKVAWRNSVRCIGRLYWQSLIVRDRRKVDSADEIAQELVRHLRQATNGGRIRPCVTVFAPELPRQPAPRVWNDQVVRYAGYTRSDGSVLGDPVSVEITAAARNLGWPGGPGTPFDVLPLIVHGREDKPRWFELPDSAVLQVPIEHPEYGWFARLGARWYAVPVVSGMRLEIGGVRYPLAPFNGWYMGTEIGARNLADTDRYNLLPGIARRLGLDTSHDRSLWKDRALVELNIAVLHSFEKAGVTISDHHTESRHFLTHIAREERAGRGVGADWSWIVPPVSSAATPVFHRYYDTEQRYPAFVGQPKAPTDNACFSPHPAREDTTDGTGRTGGSGGSGGPDDALLDDTGNTHDG
ncbi:nitric oxide synthase oxygenase [Streptomyces sp. FIT100]|uniref:nitric oxide synthase oxygenase n=1 Tax=Streptomyces sp. FIT100 TaxID=2837956 RepID=UPI0021C94000|nr:nitric oxide synthase oxygenase [Streptomyces sp. FIT100]